MEALFVKSTLYAVNRKKNQVHFLLLCHVIFIMMNECFSAVYPPSTVPCQKNSFLNAYYVLKYIFYSYPPSPPPPPNV